MSLSLPVSSSENLIMRPDFCLEDEGFFRAIQGELSEGLVEQFASQGFYETADKTAAFFHDSTNCAEYSRTFHKGLAKGLNMDSGAILQRLVEKSNAACVADGVSSAKLPSAFAAHLYCKLLIEKLASGHPLFTDDASLNKRMVTNLFQEIGIDARCKLIRFPGQTDGQSTLGFVDCRPLGERRYQVLAGALGDVVIYHYSTKTKQSRLINTIVRRSDANGKPDQRDTGGYLSLLGENYNLDKTSAEVFEVEEEDLLLLATDGLYDNLNQKETEAVVSFLINCSFFDQTVEALVKCKGHVWEDSPTVSQLRGFVQENGGELEPSLPPEPATAVKRLNAYLKLLMYEQTVYDEKFYEIYAKIAKLPLTAQSEREQLWMELGKGPLSGKNCKFDDIMLVCIHPANSNNF